MLLLDCDYDTYVLVKVAKQWSQYISDMYQWDLKIPIVNIKLFVSISQYFIQIQNLMSVNIVL